MGGSKTTRGNNNPTSTTVMGTPLNVMEVADPQLDGESQLYLQNILKRALDQD